MISIAKEIDPLGFEDKFIAAGIRSDGRCDLSSLRPFEISTGVIGTADASASCAIGKTRVIAGLTAGVFCFPENTSLVSKSGKINVSCDLSLKYPGDRRQAQSEGGALCQKLENILHTGFDFSQLAVWENGPVWDLSIHLVVLLDDGCLLDCTLLAAFNALSTTKLPNLTRELAIDASVPAKQIEVGACPVAFTFCKVSDDQWIIDPTADEEKVFPRLQIVVRKDRVAGLFGLEGPSAGQEPVGFDMDYVLDNLMPLVQLHAPKRGGV
jgi:exosome complex RNA-binding protein Rrp42 (RNase PH superfamily)